MTLVTLQAIEGLERGQVYQNLKPPITMGREEENSIRLNDERVSRFHAKIQEDQGHLIFTDLGSTNGSRVNGVPVHLHVLQVGDQISIGRCLLVLGDDEELAQFFAEQGPPAVSLTESGQLIDDETESAASIKNGASEEPIGDSGPVELPRLVKAPELPQGLNLLQKTLLSDYLVYVHGQLGQIISTARQMNPDEADSNEGLAAENMQEESADMQMSWSHWQQLIQLEIQLSRHLKKLADPEE
ncbi:Oxoglutarate dehydrogenase inhibitor [Polystyrenella longa]|uniref:Oxoglutarate dehydrogenase inhibitor n=1 Tax=Polystyrenella longa TaxID=2528007 RepID=A0A518CGQ6_9PLAN|nr:FHA domain-containing protein [Polystyrenella longa]QDU78408.1 Oxoglutarate dehydrogenase inhibitor [Polystyrenella longa]